MKSDRDQPFIVFGAPDIGSDEIDEVVATLKYTLDLRLEGNRAPFMFGAHSDTYSSEGESTPGATLEERQEAIEEFIQYALEKPEVRIVPIRDILSWMRDPKPLE